jgi:hypothetical protein
MSPLKLLKDWDSISAREYFLLHRVHSDSGSHPAIFLGDHFRSFHFGKNAGA